MAMTINTNASSLNAQRNLSTSQSSLANTLQRLSSGLRVNSAKDDAAGLAISERMNTQVRGMNVAIRNANDGISLAQTAEGALGRIGDNLQRMRELAVQSANDTYSAEDRAMINAEYAQLVAENVRITENTKFNGQTLLDGAGGDGGTFSFQIGANTSADNQISIVTEDVSADFTYAGDLGDDAATARSEIDEIDNAINAINDKRANMGAAQNRFEAVIANLNVAVENQAGARGRILDADFAAETANLSRTQILQQAGTAMLAQANSLPQNVLSLLR